MNRFWLGIALLAIFLGLGIGVTVAMDRTHTPISEVLEAAAEQAMAGELEAGIDLARQARQDWEDHWHGTAAVADHGSMDEIDGLFAQMDSYARAGRETDFAAYCARLSKLVYAMGEAQSFSWWNLL